ncbi:MAG: hypothetical protein IJT43_12720, partial [Stomatobaculum sp.]|nr:hypothetical protein [Stomatobaculum sp.]
MILIDNRELLIPNNERYIGTTQDGNSETRVFRMRRLSQAGVDLSGLTFRLDLKYPETRTKYTFTTSTNHSGGSVVVLSATFLKFKTTTGNHVFTFNGTNWTYDGNTVDLREKGVVINFTPVSGNTVTVTLSTAQVDTDTVLLTKEISDEHILLTWLITPGQLAVPGTVFVYVRGSDESGTVRFAAFYGAFYVDQNLTSPASYHNNLSELEQLEGAVDSGLRKIEYLYTKYIDLSTAAENAEAWAAGTRGGVPVQAGDDTYEKNARFFRQIAERYAKGTEDGETVVSGAGFHDNAKYYAEQADEAGEKWTRGTVDGVAVGSSDETYHNNAKYYAEQSDGYSNTSERYAKGTEDGTAVQSGVGFHDNAKYYAEQADEAGEKWTRGTVDGVAVDSEDETYHNNAKYYAGVAEDEKDLAAQYGSGLKTQVDANTAGITNLGTRMTAVAAAVTGNEATEIADARVAAKSQSSKTYSLMGDAVRGQVDFLQSEIDRIGSFEEMTILSWEAGGIDDSDGTEETDNAIRTGFMQAATGFIRLYIPYSYAATVKAFFYETADEDDYDDDYTRTVANTDGLITISAPEGYYFRLALYKTTNASSITTDDGENVTLWQLVPTNDAVAAGIASVATEVQDIRTDYEGGVYQSAGAHVRKIETDLADLAGDLTDILGASVPNGLEIDEEDQLWLTANGSRIGEPVDISSAGSGGGGTAG